jgi:hypothetical protein
MQADQEIYRLYKLVTSDYIQKCVFDERSVLCQIISILFLLRCLI